MIPALIITAVLLLVLAWFFFSGRDDSAEPTARRDVNDEIDRTELEQAEREVRDADDEESVRDWGPGTGKPRPPELL